MLALVELELRMPVTCWPVMEMDDVAAFRLLAVTVLPTVLLLMLFVPAATWMPVSEAEIVLAEPLTVTEPMLLLAMATVPLLADPMPKVVPPVPAVVTETDPVPVSVPMVLPVTVPMFAAPACRWIPLHTPGSVLALLELVQIMFASELPCTLLGVVVPTLSRMPWKRKASVVSVVVQAVPPAFGALPPIELPVTVKLLPAVLLT